jgi:hypothetical protein
MSDHESHETQPSPKWGIPPEYRAAVTELLLECQMIEQLLVVHLMEMDRIVDERLAPLGIRMKANPKDLLKLSMGRLVRRLATRTDNTNLIHDLERLVEHRNHAAHETLVWAFFNENPEHAELARLGMEKHATEARSMVSALMAENARMLAAHRGEGE